jgi:hypothetical protein
VEDRGWERVLRWALMIAAVLLIVWRVFWPLIGRFLGGA